jgi:cell volume regulation protein A
MIGTSFIREMLIGGVIGVGVGWLSTLAMRRLHLDVAGLYLVFSLASGLVAFGGAQVLHGSGFISVYATGVLIGHARLPFERGLRRFHDGVAWIAQVGVFVLLGLLAFPSRLLSAAPRGLVLAVVLVLIARPLSVWVSTLFFRYDWRDRLIIALGGLRGAVPVVLATIPLAAQLPGAGTIFDVTFFAVMVSILVQSTLITPVARRLGKLEPEGTDASVSLELTALRETGQELLGYRVEKASYAAGQPVRQLPLPADALVVLVVRRKDVISPRGSTMLEENDQVYVLSAVSYRKVVAELFRERSPDEAVLAEAREHEFSLDARIATLGDLEDFYGLELGRARDEPVAEWLDRTMRSPAAPGLRVPLGGGSGISLVVLSVHQGRPHQVAVEFTPPADAH